MKTSAKKLERLDPVRLASNPRASLLSWLKYKDIVLGAMAQHPRPYIYKPSNMTPSSVTSKIRDAIRGCIAFGYEGVNHSDLAKWWIEVVVKHDNENVYIGPFEEVQSVLSGETVSKDNGLTFPTLAFEEVAAFQILLSNGRLLGPIRILQPPDISLLPKRPNVVLMPRPDGSLHML